MRPGKEPHRDVRVPEMNETQYQSYDVIRHAQSMVKSAYIEVKKTYPAIDTHRLKKARKLWQQKIGRFQKGRSQDLNQSQVLDQSYNAAKQEYLGRSMRGSSKSNKLSILRYLRDYLPSEDDTGNFLVEEGEYEYRFEQTASGQQSPTQSQSDASSEVSFSKSDREHTPQPWDRVDEYSSWQETYEANQEASSSNKQKPSYTRTAETSSSGMQESSYTRAWESSYAKAQESLYPRVQESPYFKTQEPSYTRTLGTSSSSGMKKPSYFDIKNPTYAEWETPDTSRTLTSEQPYHFLGPDSEKSDARLVDQYYMLLRSTHFRELDQIVNSNQRIALCVDRRGIKDRPFYEPQSHTIFLPVEAMHRPKPEIRSILLWEMHNARDRDEWLHLHDMRPSSSTPAEIMPFKKAAYALAGEWNEWVNGVEYHLRTQAINNDPDMKIADLYITSRADHFYQEQNQGWYQFSTYIEHMMKMPDNLYTRITRSHISHYDPAAMEPDWTGEHILAQMQKEKPANLLITQEHVQNWQSSNDAPMRGYLTNPFLALLDSE